MLKTYYEDYFSVTFVFSCKCIIPDRQACQDFETFSHLLQNQQHLRTFLI